MVQLRRRFLIAAVRTLALALALTFLSVGQAHAQFGMGYGGSGMGYGGMGFGGMGYGGMGYGGNGGMGYGGYGGYGGMGYGGFGNGAFGGMGNGGFNGYGYGGFGYYGLGAGYLPPGYSAGYVNPMFGVGLSPLGVQSALGDRTLRGNFAPGTASYSRGYQVAPRAYYPGRYGYGR